METADAKVQVRILFFGATADLVGVRELLHTADSQSTTAEALAEMTQKFPRLRLHKLLFALNQQYATGSEVICDGDELAMFSAVSGG